MNASLRMSRPEISLDSMSRSKPETACAARATRRSARHAAAWLVASSVGLASVPASATDAVDNVVTLAPEEITEERAVELFEAGRYEEAIDIFQTLYDRGGSPNFLYNIARIYEDDGQLAKAIEYYEQFVHARGAGLEERKLASERAAALREILGTSKPPPVEETTTEPEPESQPAPAEPADDTADADDDGEPDDDASGPSGLAIAGYSLLGVGVATAGVGGVVAALALADHRTVSSGPVRDNASAIQMQGQRKALTADVLFGVGGVLVVSGVAMVIADAVKRRRQTETAQKRRWRFSAAPSLGPTGAGIQLSARI